ncbi:MAG: hypothetical protein CMJ64_11095 [Planctomycetaceae bacterium]|nr:hypothetical protein [Planctomycetaceae bacterium]
MSGFGNLRVDDDVLKRARECGSTAFMVYAVLVYHAGSSDRCWPGEDRIAELAGVSVRTVQLSLAKLKKAGFVNVDARRRNGRRTSNLYALPQKQVATDCALNEPPPKATRKTLQRQGAMDCAETINNRTRNRVFLVRQIAP